MWEDWVSYCPDCNNASYKYVQLISHKICARSIGSCKLSSSIKTPLPSLSAQSRINRRINSLYFMK